jgi:hypothetical protein
MKSMKRLTSFLFLLSCAAAPLAAQSRANDIPVDQLPANVKQVLEQYVQILRTSKDVDEAATRITDLAGGTLVGENGKVTSNTRQFGLKKDFNNIKHYADPLIITRVNATPSNGQGYGKTAIKGMVYKIWIRKKNESQGMPAPVSIMVPEGHETITTPRLINVGSY